jgi:hypothetical protein
LVTIKGIAGKADYLAGARYIAKLDCQIKQAYLVFDDVLLKTYSWGYSFALSALNLIKIRTSIKPGNPTEGQGPTVIDGRPGLSSIQSMTVRR